jgi:hypothetical protein
MGTHFEWTYLWDVFVGDPRNDHLCDGVSEDIIAKLSRFRNLMVIARHSAFFSPAAPRNLIGLTRVVLPNSDMQNSIADNMTKRSRIMRKP